MRVGVAEALAFGVLLGVGLGGGVVGRTHPSAGQVGSGVADGLGDGLGESVAPGDVTAAGAAALAVPDGTRKASGTRAEAASATRARRLGADVGTERY